MSSFRPSSPPTAPAAPRTGPADPSAASVVCPSCAVPLLGNLPACPACHLPLRGHLAVALWETDRDISLLRVRRSGLLRDLRASAPGTPPHTPITSQSAFPAPPLPPASEHLAGAPGSRQSWTGQQVLLGAGAVLLVVAAIVFLAVAWSAIGVAGQVGVMALVTATVTAASIYSARRGLRATAETLATLAVALFVVDAVAAYELNLAGLANVDVDGYGAVVAAVVAAGCVVAARAATPVLTYRLAAVCAAATAPLLAVSALDLPDIGAAVVLLVGAMGFGLISRGLPGLWASMRVPVSVVAVAYLVLGWAASLSGMLTDAFVGAGGVAALIGLLATGGAAAIAGLHRGFAAARGHLMLSVVSLPLMIVTVVTSADRADESGFTVLAVAVGAAVCAAALSAVRASLRTHPAGVGAVVTHSVFALAVVIGHLGALDQLDTRTPLWALLTGAYLLGAGAAALTAVRHPRVRVPFVVWASMLGMAGAIVAAYPSGPAVSSVTATGCAVVFALLAAVRRGCTDEFLLGGAWVVSVLTALGFAFTVPGASERLMSPAELVALTFGVAGLTAFAYALLSRRGYVAVGGVFLSSAAVWTVLLDQEVSMLEAYTLPFAALLGVVGGVALLRGRVTRSWFTVGPALAFGLLPSALFSVVDEGVARPLVVLGIAAAVLVGGVVVRWQSPVVIGALGLLIVSVSQLAPYAVGLPRWLTFGTLGLALLVLGARYERRRRNLQQVTRWVSALH